jgi:hypothetical protein
VRYFTGLEQCSREDLENVVSNISLHREALSRMIDGEKNGEMRNDGIDHVNADATPSESSGRQFTHISTSLWLMLMSCQFTRNSRIVNFLVIYNKRSRTG